MSFTIQIGQLTGSASSNDATTIAQALENAQIETIQKVAQKQPDMLNLMSSDVTTSDNTGTNNSLLDNAIVLSVSRSPNISSITSSGTYLSLDGVNDYLTLGTIYGNADLQATSSTGITISFTVKFLQLGVLETVFFSHNHADNYSGYSVYKGTDNKMYFNYYDGSGTGSGDRRTFISAETYDKDIWYHVTITSGFTTTGSTTFFYTNGVRGSACATSGTASITTPAYNSGTVFDIGRKLPSGPDYSKLRLKEFSIWKGYINGGGDPTNPSDAAPLALYNSGAYHDPRLVTGDYNAADVAILELHLNFRNGAPIVDATDGISSSNIVLVNGAIILDDGVNCALIDKKFSTKVSDKESIYYADAFSPVYTIDKGFVKIFPFPNDNELATISKIAPGAINDGSETIANMPRFLHNQVIRLAAFYVLLQRLGELRASLPTDLSADTTAFNAITDFNDSIGVTTTLPSIPGAYSNAIDKAQALIDDVASIGGDTNTDGSGVDIYSAQKWLVDEDPEMLQSTLAVAAQELQRASTALSAHSAELNKYQAEITKESTEAGQALQEYQANLAKKIQLFTTLIGKLTTDYQWTQSQLGVIKNMIDEGWASIFTPKSDNDVSRIGVGR